MREVKDFLDRWSRTSEAGDALRHSDLYLRDPKPLVVFTDGEVCQDHLDLTVRLQRDLGRVVIRRVEVHDIVVQDLAPDVMATFFQYDLSVRDMWGVDATAHRVATMCLVRIKDGLRIASAHFSERR